MGIKIPSNSIISVVGDIHINLRNTTEAHWESMRFLELCKILAEDDSTIVVFDGDTFDKAAPTLQEIALFYEGLGIIKSKNKSIYILDGNHEELSDTLTTFDLLPKVDFYHIKLDFLETDSTYLWLVGHPNIQNITNV